MKTILVKNISFCDGVSRAYSMVAEFASKNDKKRILILGSLAHNDSVSEKVRQMGIKKIKDLRAIKENDIVIITAHGASKDVFDKILSKKAEILDTTCPKVIRAQRIAKHYADKGCKVLIFGDAGHKEVKGINGWAGHRAIIFPDLAGARKAVEKCSSNKDAEAVFLSQTTQDISEFKKICKYFRANFKKIQIFDTICKATYLRQKEAQRVSGDKNRMVVVVGGKDSGNTKRLWQICKKNNPNAFWVGSLDVFEKKILKNAAKKFKMAVIVSGASTPMWQINEVDNYLINC